MRGGLYRPATWAALAFALMLAAGCHSINLPAVNTAEPGWRLRQGQAVWQPNRKGPEIAGEIMMATHADGRAWLEFTKTPFPFVTVQTSNELWQIEFVPQHRRFSGKGSPSPRLLWVHLARALNGSKPPVAFAFERTGPNEWRIENRDSGESVFGYINP